MPTSTILQEKRKIKVLFESNTIEVMKEVFDFPLPTLVADVGGILGLFIGVICNY